MQNAVLIPSQETQERIVQKSLSRQISLSLSLSLAVLLYSLGLQRPFFCYVSLSHSRSSIQLTLSRPPLFLSLSLSFYFFKSLSFFLSFLLSLFFSLFSLSLSLFIFLSTCLSLLFSLFFLLFHFGAVLVRPRRSSHGTHKPCVQWAASLGGLGRRRARPALRGCRARAPPVAEDPAGCASLPAPALRESRPALRIRDPIIVAAALRPCRLRGGAVFDHGAVVRRRASPGPRPRWPTAPQLSNVPVNRVSTDRNGSKTDTRRIRYLMT